MICKNLLQMTGFACQPINEQGSLAKISTPFSFADGDPVPVYVQRFANDIHRFFDDGQTLLHFMGRGMKFSSGHQLRFLSNIANKHGAALNENGVIELFSKGTSPADAFAKYVSCLVMVTQWEEDHQGGNSDGAAFVEELIHALLTFHPEKTSTLKPTYIGSSGKRQELDIKLGSIGYLAVKPNQKSAAPALYKLVDITNRQSNSSEELVVVIDDRFDPVAAKNTQQVFRGIASNVISFSKIASVKTATMH